MSENAVIWIVTEPYFHEAKRSVEAVRKYLPNSDCVLLTPDHFIGGQFDKVVRVNNRRHKHWYLDEVHYFTKMLELSYEKIIFLDSDMLLVNDCSEIWELLDRFDLALAHAPTRETKTPPKHIPISFSEYCTGIMALRNNNKVKNLFQEWYATYLSDEEAFGNNDQVPLRETLWDTEIDIRVATLPTEYNCRFGLGGHAIRPIKVLHGRYGGDMQKVNEIVNATIHPRVWRQGEFPSA